MVDWWAVLPDSERQQWTLDPFVRVGPLRFGMSPDEVSDTLNGIATSPQLLSYLPSQFSKDHYSRVKGEYRELGLTLYYGGEERLRGVLVDALRGPQVFTGGMALVGRVPSVLEQWMLDRAESREPYTELFYMDAGVPGSESLGMVISARRAGDHLLTQPVFVPSEAMDDLPHFLPAEVWDIR